jgi:hypothetical protein
MTGDVCRSPERRDHGSILSATRALIGLAVGVVASAVVALVGEPELLPVVAWVVATSIALTWVWRIIRPQDHRGTDAWPRRRARSARPTARS